MKKGLLSILILFALILLALLFFLVKPVTSQVSAPVLKWQKGGCTHWCQTGWYASPAVADLDGNGTQEVIWSAYSLFVVEGETGNEVWTVASGHDRSEAGADNVGRTWPGIVVADVDGDDALEIVTAHSGGYVSVYNGNGYFEPGWPQRPTSHELRGLAVYDLDDDGTLEIIVTGAVYEKVNTWVYEHDGTLRDGWPQLSDDSGYAYGVFNDNAAVGDLDGDGAGEIVVPSDVHYICAYEPNSTQIPAHTMYDGKGWGKVGVWESLDTELRGWGRCDGTRAESYRTNFAHGPSVIADVNGDGAQEVIATGNVYDCNVGHPPGKYNGVYVFNADRSRFNTGGFDWRSLPVDTGAPLTEDYGVIENNQPNPAVADLDGDGNLEIIYSSYDGRVHAFWLDKTEHHHWPYSVYNSGEGFFRFASEPVVADLDNNGEAEVIFGSWTQKGSNRVGKLHILDMRGNLLQEVEVPTPTSKDWNGILPAPTLTNIDSDPDLEAVVGTAYTGLCAYDLPGTANARILWGTGRGNYQRSGSILTGSLARSFKAANKHVPTAGQAFSYTISLADSGPALDSVRVTDTLPAEVTYAGKLWASAGSYGQAGGVISWTGTVQPGQPVAITFEVTASQQLTEPTLVANQAVIDDGQGQILYRQATIVVNGYATHLPLIWK